MVQVVETPVPSVVLPTPAPEEEELTFTFCIIALIPLPDCKVSQHPYWLKPSLSEASHIVKAKFFNEFGRSFGFENVAEKFDREVIDFAVE